MIALIASALLGLYVFAPYIIFHRVCSFFVPLKKLQRSKTDEVVAGIVVAGLPFLVTLTLFWTGNIQGSMVPFPMVDTHLEKVIDYHAVFTAAYSDHYFTDHQAESWEALKRVCKRQADFLVWNYFCLLGETAIFIALVRRYGAWKGFKPYAWLASKILLPTVSEWHALLTDFNFPSKEKRYVEVDALSKDDILYRGSVVDYFLGTNGELSGLLLKDAQRFQYDKLKADRTVKVFKSTEQYWKTIPGGGNFYLPGDNIASLNTRYLLPKSEYERRLRKMVEKLFKGAKVEPIVPSSEEPQTVDIVIPAANKAEGEP